MSRKNIVNKEFDISEGMPPSRLQTHFSRKKAYSKVFSGAAYHAPFFIMRQYFPFGLPPEAEPENIDTMWKKESPLETS